MTTTAHINSAPGIRAAPARRQLPRRPESRAVERHLLAVRILASHVSEQREHHAIRPAKLYLHMRRRARLAEVIQIDDQSQESPLGQARGGRPLPVQSARPKLSLRGQLTNRLADHWNPSLV